MIFFLMKKKMQINCFLKSKHYILDVEVLGTERINIPFSKPPPKKPTTEQTPQEMLTHRIDRS